MERSGTEADEKILLKNIIDVARLDEEVRGLLARFETVDDETLAKLKQKIEAIETLRSKYRSELMIYRNR